MCLGFILPGTILGYGFAIIALLAGSSLLMALGVLVASGACVTLAGAFLHVFILATFEAPRRWHRSLPSRPAPKTEGGVESPAVIVASTSVSAPSAEVLSGPEAFTLH